MVALLNPFILSVEKFALIGSVPFGEIVENLNILYFYKTPLAYLFPNLGMILVLLWPVIIKFKPVIEYSYKNLLLSISALLGMVYFFLTIIRQQM